MRARGQHGIIWARRVTLTKYFRGHSGHVLGTRYQKEKSQNTDGTHDHCHGLDSAYGVRNVQLECTHKRTYQHELIFELIKMFGFFNAVIMLHRAFDELKQQL